MKYQVFHCYQDELETGIIVEDQDGNVMMRFRYADTPYGADGTEMRDIHIPFLAKQLCDRLNAHA